MERRKKYKKISIFFRKGVDFIGNTYIIIRVKSKHQKTKRRNKMVVIKINNKKVSQKIAREYLGERRINERIEAAKEYSFEEPGEPCTWMDGMSILYIAE